MKLLSIIVPSYNMEKYLPKCLSSVCDAGEKNVGGESGWTADLLDVIVVNDGSKDRTGEIAHDFERRYPGVVRVIDKPNAHYGSCVNAGLGIASGRFVKILDADDWFDTDNLARYIEFLQGVDAAVDVVFSSYNIVNETGCVTSHCDYPFTPGEIFDIEEIDAKGVGVFMHGIAYRTDLLREINYHQLEGVCYTDTEWCFTPFCKARKCIYFDKPLYQYLVGREGQSVDPGVEDKNLFMHVAVLRDMLEIYRKVSSAASSVNRTALDERLLQFLKVIYGIFLWRVNLKLATKYFDIVENLLCNTNRELYFEIVDRVGTCFHPILIVRRMPHARTLSIAGIRFATMLRRKMRGV